MLKIAWAPNYVHPLPNGHRFPMEKYNLIKEQLLYEGTAVEDNFFLPKKLTPDWVLNTHDPNYFNNLMNLTLNRSEIRKTGFPLSEKLVARELTIMEGSIQASLFGLKYGIGMNIAGGTHHAFYEKGEGFCLLNDIAISANYLLDNGLVSKVLVIDLDVHQGNGTAAIFQNQSSVFTFSMHGSGNYPLIKEHSNLDIGLPDKTGNETYLRLLKQSLGRLMVEVMPDFVIYQSGVDVLESDKLGKLSLSLEGCKERDRMVLECCSQNKIPMMCCMGGGYSERLAIIVDAHSNTFRLAQEIFF